MTVPSAEIPRRPNAVPCVTPSIARSLRMWVKRASGVMAQLSSPGTAARG
ncbi:MAG: hypothetical protein WDM88_04845 [Galbitalea sp.]